MSLDDDLNACAALVQKGDPARFRTVMAAPVSARRVLFPIYAFNVEVSRAPWATSEPMIAEMRLQWWRDALEEIAGGGPVRRHSVATPLADAIDSDMARALDGLVAARRWDCYRDAFEDEEHQRDYLRKTSGTLMQVACAALGDPAAPGAQVGFALGVANWLRACPELEAKGRVPMVDGSSAGIRSLASDGLGALRGVRIPFSSPARPAFWPADGVEKVLKVAMKSPHRVTRGGLPGTGPSPATLALKAMLGSGRGRKRRG
jgi:phytoene synthase